MHSTIILLVGQFCWSPLMEVHKGRPSQGRRQGKVYYLAWASQSSSLEKRRDGCTSQEFWPLPAHSLALPKCGDIGPVGQMEPSSPADRAVLSPCPVPGCRANSWVTMPQQAVLNHRATHRCLLEEGRREHLCPIPEGPEGRLQRRHVSGT